MYHRQHLLDVMAQHICCVQVKTRDSIHPMDHCVAANEVPATWVRTTRAAAQRKVADP